MRALLSPLLLIAVCAVTSGARAEAPWNLEIDPDEPLARTDVERGLGSVSRQCLATPRFDARANGFGTLLVVVDRAGEVREARYLGFDHAPLDDTRFPPEELARRKRLAFDELGSCLRQGAVGGRIGGVRHGTTRAAIRFRPPA